MPPSPLRALSRSSIAGSPLALRELVDELKVSLELNATMPLAAAVRQAGILLGDTSEGPLLLKARRLAGPLSLLSATVMRIKAELGLSQNLTTPVAMREAHKVLGVVAEGDSLAAQGERLKKLIGIS